MPADTVEARVTELKQQLRQERLGATPRPRRPKVAPKRPPGALRAALFGVAKIAAAIILPFFVCVRGSTYLYARGIATWIAVFAAAGVALCLVAIFTELVSRRLTGKARFAIMMKWVALPLVAGWCGYALFYLARANAKTDEVRRSYTALHPIMRIALSTAILADAELTVTDMDRVPGDYARMGLAIFDRTLHYKQADGWAHAMDLRTKGHGEARNRAVQLYFRTMGFRTLRHVGTADHLHVELPLVRR